MKLTYRFLQGQKNKGDTTEALGIVFQKGENGQITFYNRATDKPFFISGISVNWLTPEEVIENTKDFHELQLTLPDVIYMPKEDAKGFAPQELLLQRIDELRREAQTPEPERINAGEIPIIDEYSLFSADTVEGALAELAMKTKVLDSLHPFPPIQPPGIAEGGDIPSNPPSPLFLRGEKGDKGDAGERGQHGEKGDKGDPGEPGKDGKDGEPGEDADLDQVKKLLKADLKKLRDDLEDKIRRNAGGVVFLSSDGGGTVTPGAVTQTITAGVTLSANKLLAVDDEGMAILADCTNFDHLGRIIGVSKTSALAGAEVEYTLSGIHENDTWNWVMGQAVFLSTNGELTQTAPISGFSMIIGYPETQTKLNVRIEPTIELI